MQRIVLLFPGALGDLILALPAWRGLRARHAGAHVTVVVNGVLRALAERAGVAEASARIDGPDVAALFAGSALPAWMGARPVVYSWIGASDAGLRARIAAAAASVTFRPVERGDQGPHAAAAYARGVGLPDDLGALARATAIPAPVAPRPGSEARRQAAPLLAVHAGAGSGAKCWPLDRYRAIVAWWRARGGRVVEVRGPAEEAMPPVGADALLDDLSLVALAATLAEADGYLGNDSGVSHLAGAVGCRGVVVFGPTCAARWRPLGGGLRALTAAGRDASDGPWASIEAVRDALDAALS